MDSENWSLQFAATEPGFLLDTSTGTLPLPPPGAVQSESAAIPESNSARDEDQEDFGTIRAYFDEEEEKFELVSIGKLYDHMMKLYGGEYKPQYEEVLKIIKDYLLFPSADKDRRGEEVYDDRSPDLLEEAEMRLMRIATDKTNNETEGHHLQNQNSNKINKDNIVGMGDKFPDYYDYEDLPREGMAVRVLFHHVVKMDEGNCSSQYKSVLQLVPLFHPITREIGYYKVMVDKVVRKLDEIEERKGNGLTDNATTGVQTDVLMDLGKFFMDEEEASQNMRWAMSNRRLIQEFNFRDEMRYLMFGALQIVHMVYDHLEELDGGQCRYEYIKAFRKLFKQIRTPAAGDWIKEVEVMFKEIAIKKMHIKEPEEYQEVSNLVEKRMCYNDIKWFEGYEDDRDDWYRKVDLTAKLIPIIYRHLLILDRSDCLVQYTKAFEIIKDIYVVMLLDMKYSELQLEMDDISYTMTMPLKKKLKEIAQKKMNEESNINKQKENIVAATAAADTEEVSSSYIVPNDGDADIRPAIQLRHNWLDSSEILQILENFESSEISEKIKQKPPSGSLILYDTKALRFYKKDGYNWQKQKDGKTVTEGHMILKVGGHQKLHCYYAHGKDDDKKFQRRTYSLLKKSSSIRLVHYLDVNSEDNDKNENVGREAEDNALDVVHESSTRVKSAGTSIRTKKRPRRDSDGDDMNSEIDNQVHFPQNANRAISINTSSLDDEMVRLANEVESLPGFRRGSDWFISAMFSFIDKDKKALFKAMPDPDSKVKMLKMILTL